MISRFQRFTLTAVASAALLACWANTASAVELHSEIAHTEWLGSQVGEDAETFNAGSWRCKSATYAGTTSSATGTRVEVLPAWSGCTAFAFVNVTRDVNGCRYVLYNTGVMDIVCPAGSAMVITAFNCYITIPAQTGLKTVSYTNEGSGSSRDIKVSTSITGLKYSQESKSFPGCVTGNFTNGTIQGTTTFKGVNTAGEQVGIWVQ
jgi:hypothetical protein